MWLVFSGNGSQWPGMGRGLLAHSATFKQSIEQSAEFLQPLNINLMACFMADDGWTVTTNASLGLLALQIALVDMLRQEYAVEASGWLGHSAGNFSSRPKLFFKCILELLCG